jgi:hypothetical protein
MPYHSVILCPDLTCRHIYDRVKVHIASNTIDITKISSCIWGRGKYSTLFDERLEEALKKGEIDLAHFPRMSVELAKGTIDRFCPDIPAARTRWNKCKREDWDLLENVKSRLEEELEEKIEYQRQRAEFAQRMKENCASARAQLLDINKLIKQAKTNDMRIPFDPVWCVLADELLQSSEMINKKKFN